MATQIASADQRRPTPGRSLPSLCRVDRHRQQQGRMTTATRPPTPSVHAPRQPFVQLPARRRLSKARTAAEALGREGRGAAAGVGRPEGAPDWLHQRRLEVRRWPRLADRGAALGRAGAHPSHAGMHEAKWPPARLIGATLRTIDACNERSTGADKLLQRHDATRRFDGHV